MIRCDRLEEIQSLAVIVQYCINHNDNCADCKLLDICDCMMKVPCRWGLRQEDEKGEDEQ